MSVVIRVEGGNPVWAAYGEHGPITVHDLDHAERFVCDYTIYDALKDIAINLKMPPSMLRIETEDDARKVYDEFLNRKPAVNIECDGRSVTVHQDEFIKLLETADACPAFRAINDAFDFIEC